MKLHEPEFPLVAVVFTSARPTSSMLAGRTGFEAAESIIGYYSLRTQPDHDVRPDRRRVAAPADAAVGTAAQINRMLAQPEAEQLVATIIHEATHQIAFNSGLQTRFADIPLWVSEGIAVFFETPDLGSAKGWRTIGAVNTTRLARFANTCPGGRPRR